MNPTMEEHVLKKCELTAEAQRVAKVKAQLERVHHSKSTKQMENEVQSLLAGNIKHGFILPVQQVGVLHLFDSSKYSTYSLEGWSDNSASKQRINSLMIFCFQ